MIQNTTPDVPKTAPVEHPEAAGAAAHVEAVQKQLASPDVRSEVQDRMVPMSANRRVETVADAASDAAVRDAIRQRLERRAA